jgi:hypothetical protein
VHIRNTILERTGLLHGLNSHTLHIPHSLKIYQRQGGVETWKITTMEMTISITLTRPRHNLHHPRLQSLMAPHHQHSLKILLTQPKALATSLTLTKLGIHLLLPPSAHRLSQMHQLHMRRTSKVLRAIPIPPGYLLLRKQSYSLVHL